MTITINPNLVQAIRDRQKLLGVKGYLSPESCEKFFYWYCDAQKDRGIKSIKMARIDSLINGKAYLEAEQQKMIELIKQESGELPNE